MEPLLRIVGAAVYAALRTVLVGAVRLYYRAIEVRHPERLPASGPLLIVANHPASLTDVLVLGAAIPRRLHFVAHSGLFRPALRGAVLRLAGTVPVYRREDDPALVHRNDEMFSACHQLLDGGGVVLIFPEGTSQSDRKVERLKTGAARLALANAFRPGRPVTLTLLPIGLHFAERTAFRSLVSLSVGRPFELEPYRAGFAADPQQAVRELTDAIQVVLEKLILNVPSADLAALVHDIERIYLEELRAAAPGAPDLALVRALADSIEWYRRTDPERLYRMWREVSGYHRKLAALDLRDPALRGTLPGTTLAHPARLLLGFALGVVPAAAGALVHIVPYQLSALAGGWFARDPTRIAFARMMSGLVLIPITYALLVQALMRWTTLGGGGIAAALVAVAMLGLFALVFLRWVKRRRHELRLLTIASVNRRMLARVRIDRRRLIRMLDQARADYVAQHPMAGPAAAP